MVGVCPRVCQICLHYNIYEGFVKHFGYQFCKLVDMVFILCYHALMNIKPLPLLKLNDFNLTTQQVAKLAGLTWPTAHRALHPELRAGDRVGLSVYIAIVIALRPKDWQRLTLGELFEVTDD